MRAISTLALSTFVATLLCSSPARLPADTHTERAARPAKRGAAERIPEHQCAEALPESVQKVIELTNRERLKAGLPALKCQRNLLDSAGWLAADMASHRYFDHRDSGGRPMPARISEFRYSDYSALGENIALGQRTPEEVVEGWMNSPGHRANILSRKFSEIGVGYVRAADRPGGGGYWVQDFGSRFDQCPVVIDTGGVTTSTCRVKLSIHGDDWVQQMRLSNDGTHWTAWEEFRPLRDWTLDSGTGTRTVYVEVRQAQRVERLEAAIHVDAAPDAHTVADAGVR